MQDTPVTDEKPTLIAASPSQSMLQVADPTEEMLAHPADDEPNTMVTQAPPRGSLPPGSLPDALPQPSPVELRMPLDMPVEPLVAARESVVPELPAEERVVRAAAISAPSFEGRVSDSRPRIPTPRMDMHMYTPASIGPTALTLAPATPASMPVSRAPIPFPAFDAKESRSLQPRLHPVAWIGIGVVIGAAAMAAFTWRGGKDAAANAAPSANVPTETDLDTVAPMPSAKPSTAPTK